MFLAQKYNFGGNYFACMFGAIFTMINIRVYKIITEQVLSNPIPIIEHDLKIQNEDIAYEENLVNDFSYKLEKEEIRSLQKTESNSGQSNISEIKSDSQNLEFEIITDPKIETSEVSKQNQNKGSLVSILIAILKLPLLLVFVYLISRQDSQFIISAIIGMLSMLPASLIFITHSKADLD